MKSVVSANTFRKAGAVSRTKPLARNTDPSTSHEAAAYMKRGKRLPEQRDCVARIVEMHPGHTASELSQFCYLDRYQIQRRLSELTGSRVRKGDARRCSMTGRSAVTWYAV